MTLMHVEPWVAACTTCLGMMTSVSSWVNSRSFLFMTTPLNISTGTDEGPVTRRLCFAVVLWVFPFSCSCWQIVLTFVFCCCQSSGLGWQWCRGCKLVTSASLLHCPWCSCRALRAVLEVPVKYDIDITVLKLSEYVLQYTVHVDLDDAFVWPLNYPEKCTDVNNSCLGRLLSSRGLLNLQLLLQLTFDFVILMSPLPSNIDVGTGASSRKKSSLRSISLELINPMTLESMRSVS